MIFDQFMPAVYRNTYFNVKRQTDFNSHDNIGMDNIDRTPFGKRLYDARTYAELTQDQAARAVGMAQGTLAEAEVSGKRSGYTVQLAALYKVNAGWLATGRGKMHLSLDDADIDFKFIAPTHDPVVDDLAALAALRPEEANAYRANIKRDLAAAMREQRPAKRFLGLAEPERRIEDTGAFHKKRFTDINTPAPQPGKKGVKK